MATQLDLQEQEQLDALKAFWNKQGNLITWVLVLVLAAFAGWNGWQWYQRDQAAKAAAIYDELDRAARAGDADRSARIFDDLKTRFPNTAYAQQGGLLAARVQFDQSKPEVAQSMLAWVGEHAVETEARAIARLRLAALQIGGGQHADALKTLDAVQEPGFGALADDRRGDALLAQGKPDAARQAYTAAVGAMADDVDYRRLVEAKLIALGGSAPAGAAVGAAASSGARP